ncbi:MAG: OsmC family protein [Balneolales bacterium]
MKVTIDRINEAYHMEARNEDGNTVQIDNSPDGGGSRLGVRPMQMMLMAVGGCSAIDIIGILNKQNQKIDDLSIEVDGEREKDKVPSLFEAIEVSFFFTGDLDPAKVKRAVKLSMEKYCSVSKTLEYTAEIGYKIFVNKIKV